MRTVRKGLVGLLLLGAAIAAAQSTRSRVVDPFFLIEYDPAKIHFGSTPSRIRQQCEEISERYAKAWVYSHVKTKDTEYFILYGYIKVPLEEHPGRFSTQLEDGDGVIVALRGGTCRVDQWQFFLKNEVNRAKDATPLYASDSVRDAIAADVFRRYARAFGGKKSFLRQVTPEARKGLPPVVLKELEIFEKAP